MAQLFRACMAALMLSWMITGPVAGAEPGPEQRIGRHVFVVPDPYAKSVTGWVLVRAGCADEAGSCLGIAHYLEHLLFINRDADHRSKVSLFPAGNGNGWTTATATGYTQNFPVREETKAQSLDKLVAYLAHLLDDVRADPQQAQRERNIVLQEYNQRLGNSVSARFQQRRTALLLPDDPLGMAVIGSPETIAAFDVPRAVAFHKAWYTINNAAFVFSGPISAADIEPLVAKYITPLVARELPPRAWLQTPPPTVRRDSIAESDKTISEITVTYDKIVTYDEPETIEDQLTLAAARSVIGSFFASRLAGSPLDTMIEKEELIARGGFSVRKVRPGMMRLSFAASPSAGIAPERLRAAAERYISGLKPGLIKAAYLQRLKKRAAVGRDLLREEPSRYASSLVSWLQGPYDYDAWVNRAAVDERLEVRHLDLILAALARPGREVVGTLRPATTVSASKP